MIQTTSPFSDPNFLRSVRIIPFETELTPEEIRAREVADIEAYWQHNHDQRTSPARGVTLGLLFSLMAAIAVGIAVMR